MRLVLLISLLFFASCAQMFPPSGGIKDETPPEISKEGAVPANKTVNFNSKTIIIPFNEYIKLNNPAENIIISPAMEEKPEFILKGKKLQINLKSELKPNTTYTINFGNAISDITENNVAAGLSYVFSTGAILDSLKISGTVTNAYTNAGEKGVWVLLHRNLSDTAYQKCFPDYLAKTDANGNYVLQNLSAGEYRIFALKDGNSDYKYSQPSEEIAFHSEILKVNEKNENVNLKMFKEDNEKPYVKNARFYWPGYAKIVMGNPKKEIFQSAFYYPENRTEERKMLSVISNEKGDTLQINFQGGSNEFENVSEIGVYFWGISFIDTFKIQIPEKKQTIYNLKLKSNASGNFNLFDDLILKFDHLILTKPDLNKERILLFKNDTVLLNIPHLSMRQNSVFIEYTWEENTKYKVILLDSAIMDLQSNYTKPDTIHFTTVKKSYYGNIIAKMEIPDGKYVIQITGQGDKMMYEESILGKADFSVSNIPPGNYKVKIFEDKDGDGKWSTGILNDKKQPERIWYYKENIVIRSNWDYELNWKIEN